MTDPAGNMIATLERSKGYPYRSFSFSWLRGQPAGSCSLEYAEDAGVDRSIFDKGNLIWMNYRGETRVYVSRGRKRQLTKDEHGSDWSTVTGVAVKLALLKRRIIWPSSFNPATLAGRTPSTWPKAWATTLGGAAASGQRVVPVTSTAGAAVGMPFDLISATNSIVAQIASVQAGVSVTTVDPLSSSFAIGDRAADATKQWRRFVNRAAGSMLWDLINESNSRPDGYAFPIAITQGTIQTTGADGWTQDFRFQRISDVVDAVEAAFGDVDIVGDPTTGHLVYNYYNSIGSDRSGAVTFEEGADILDLEVDETPGTSDEPATYVVGGGADQGVIQPTFGVADSGATDRVEAYADLRDATTAAQVQTETTAALAAQQLLNGTSIALDIADTRFTAITNFGKGDTVTAIAPSRGLNVAAQIVGLYIIEDPTERVHVKVDLGAPRTSEEIKARARQKAAAQLNSLSSLGTRGQLVPINFSDSVYFDTATASVTSLYIPDRLYVTIEARVAIDFDQYPMPVSAASSSGGSTVTSAASSASTTAGKAHVHPFAVWNGNTPGAFTKRQFGAYKSGAIAYFNLETDALTSAGFLDTDQDGAGGHAHNMPHTHDATLPDHTHPLTAGSSKEAYPASHNVTLNVYLLVGTTWTQQGATITGLTTDAPVLDLTAYITGPGRWRIVLQSAAAQPNGGRIGAHMSGYVLGGLQSS
jgi:hypothetical protein